MTETTARIRWHEEYPGTHYGHVGTLETWKFELWQAPGDCGDYKAGDWVLTAPFALAHWEPPVFGRDPDEIKAKAERLLERFVSSLGAVFEPEPAKSRKSRAWHADWTVVDRDQDGNAILKHKPSGGLFRILPVEER